MWIEGGPSRKTPQKLNITAFKPQPILSMSLPLRVVQLSSVAEQVKEAVLLGGLAPYFKKTGLFTLGGVGRHIKWRSQSNGSLFGKLGYFRSKNLCIFRFRMIFIPRDSGTEVILKVEHGPFSRLLMLIAFVVGLCMCGIGVVFYFLLSASAKRGQNHILQYLQGHLVDWDRGRDSAFQNIATTGAIPPEVPNIGAVPPALTCNPLALNPDEGDSGPEGGDLKIADSLGCQPNVLPAPDEPIDTVDMGIDSAVGSPANQTSLEMAIGIQNKEDNRCGLKIPWWRSLAILLGLLAAFALIASVFQQSFINDEPERKSELEIRPSPASSGAASAPENMALRRKILGSWKGDAILTFYEDGTMGLQANEEAKVEKNGQSWRIEGGKLLLLKDGQGGWVNLVRLDDSVLIMKFDSGNESRYQRLVFENPEVGKPAPSATTGGRSVEIIEATEDSVSLAHRESDRLAGSPSTGSEPTGSMGTTGNEKLIVGRWLEAKYVIFYPDGTWGEQRHEDALIDTNGRNWSLAGDRLTRTSPGETYVESIVSLDRIEMLLKDASGKVSTYKWVAPGSPPEPQRKENTREDAGTPGGGIGETDKVGGGAQRLPAVAMPGEKYPESRLRLLTVAEVGELSMDSIRYAINEMFARHGGTFGKAEIRQVFEQFSWYRPRPDVDFDHIEQTELNEIERANLKMLATARDLAATPRPPTPSSPAPSALPRVVPFHQGTWVMRSAVDNLKDTDYFENTLTITGNKFKYTMKFKSVLKPGAPSWTNHKISHLRSFSGTSVYSGAIVDVGENTFGAKVENVTWPDKSPLHDLSVEKDARRKIGAVWKYVYRNGILKDARNESTTFNRP